MFTLVNTSRSLTGSGALKAWRILRATRVTSPTCATLASTTVNSSPPRRATVSPGHTQACRSLGHRLEHGIAWFVPEGVVDDLETVEIEEQHGHQSFALVASRMVARSRSQSGMRLGSPLSPS